ncbi:hypothetical protein D3C78_1337390 [compost metagenome]
MRHRVVQQGGAGQIGVVVQRAARQQRRAGYRVDQVLEQVALGQTGIVGPDRGYRQVDLVALEVGRGQVGIHLQLDVRESPIERSQARQQPLGGE